MKSFEALQFHSVLRKEFGDISASFASMGTGPTTPWRGFIISNLTNVTVTLSDDGTTDKFDLGSGQVYVLDVTANRTLVDNYFMAARKTFYVRYYDTAPTAGFVSLTILTTT